MVAIPALFMNLSEVTDLTSIGTLFAFVLVCGGVLKLEHGERTKGGARGPSKKTFRVPYFNSKYAAPCFLVGGAFLAYGLNAEGMQAFFSLESGKPSVTKSRSWFTSLG